MEKSCGVELITFYYNIRIYDKYHGINLYRTKKSGVNYNVKKRKRAQQAKHKKNEYLSKKSLETLQFCNNDSRLISVKT